jgi:hypothetical protein
MHWYNCATTLVSVLLGKGDGSFTTSTPASGVGLRNTPYLTDLLGHPDGVKDSVILDRSGNLLFRQGLPGTDNQFAPPVTLNPSRPARDLAVLQTARGRAIATADASPDPDLLVSEHQFVYAVSLYTSSPDGQFHRATAFSTTFLPTRIAAADLSGNGLDDIVVADSLNDCVQVVFQQPDGSFSHPLTLPVGVAPSDIALVDVDGDGRQDIVVTDQASGDVTVLLNEGNESFAPPERFRAGTGLYGLDSASATASPQNSVSLGAGNFTGNGRNDLVVVNQGAHSFSVLPNDGSGGFADPQAALTTSTSDGLAVNNKPGPVVTFSIAAGTTPTGLNVVRNPQTGFLDLLVGNPFGDVLRLRGRGDGTFGPPGSRVALAVQPDLLGPGRPGVLLTNQQADHATVQAPASAGQFVKVKTLDASAPTDGQPARLHPADPLTSSNRDFCMNPPLNSCAQSPSESCHGSKGGLGEMPGWSIRWPRMW